MARQLATLGVDVIEAGFPIASEADAESVRLVATHVRGAGRRRPGAMHAGRHRSRRLGARAGRAAAHPHLHRHVRSAPRAQAADVARGLPRRRRRRGPPRATLHRRRPVLGGGRDAKRHGLPLPRRRRGHLGGMHDRQPAGHRRLLDAGRDRRRSSARSSRACRTPATPSFSTHCHDDLGLAVANTLAAVSAGATQVECTINGVGERAGNASLEEIVMATRVRADLLPFETRIETREIYPDQPAADGAHRRKRAGEQGHRRPQRVRARGRHSPGRDAEGPPHLRDHAARGSRRAAGDARARQALGPPRRAAALRAARHDASIATSSIGSTRRSSSSPIARKSSATTTSRPSSSASARARRMRSPCTRRPISPAPQPKPDTGTGCREPGLAARDSGSERPGVFSKTTRSTRACESRRSSDDRICTPHPDYASSESRVPSPASPESRVPNAVTRPPTPPSRSSPDSSAGRRRSRGVRRCDTPAAAAARPSGPASAAGAIRGS